MSIAISDINLREIYNLSNEDKLDLVDLIIKSMKAVRSKYGINTNGNISTWVDELEGKWIDDKSAEMMIEDIKSARTSNSDIVLCKSSTSPT